MRSLHIGRSGLVTVALSLVVAGCASDGADTTTTVPSSTSTVAETTSTSRVEPTTTTVDATTTTTISAAEALAIVEAAFAAFRAGDMETWHLWREGGEYEPGDGDYDLAVQTRIEVEECVHRGYGEWLMDDLMIGHAFDCPATQTDLFMEAAGMVLEMNYEWVIGTSPETSLGGSNEDFFTQEVLMLSFRAWLEENHPEVAATVEYDEDGANPLPASVPTALEFIDEFVAQSDAYPLTEPVPPLPFP